MTQNYKQMRFQKMSKMARKKINWKNQCFVLNWWMDTNLLFSNTDDEWAMNCVDLGNLSPSSFSSLEYLTEILYQGVW